MIEYKFMLSSVNLQVRLGIDEPLHKSSELCHQYASNEDLSNSVADVFSELSRRFGKILGKDERKNDNKTLRNVKTKKKSVELLSFFVSFYLV